MRWPAVCQGRSAAEGKERVGQVRMRQMRVPASLSPGPSPVGAGRDAAGSVSPTVPAGVALPDYRLLPCLLVLALFVRGLGFIHSVIDPDESLYIVQAREWLRGGWPYLAVWDMHPVGAPALIALMMMVVGQDVLAARLLGTLAVTATAWLLHRIVLLCSETSSAALAAAVLYIAYSVQLDGMATNTELLMAPFLALGVAVALSAARRTRPGGQVPGLAELFGMGLCFGVALWIKQVTAPVACLAFAALCGCAIARRAAGIGRLALWTLAFVLGAALPMLATALAYALHGALGAFIEANVIVPLRYSTVWGNVPHGGPRMIIVAVATHAWLFAAAASLLAWRPAWRGPLLAAALLWFLGTLVAILLPGKFYSHYFLLWLPPLCLAAGPALVAGAMRLARPERARQAALAAVALVASIPAFDYLAGRAREGFALRLPDPPRLVAQRIVAMRKPGETVWLVNYEPIVYVLADLPLPSRLVLPSHLVGFFGGPSPEESARELRRIVASRPDILVYYPADRDVMAPEAREAVDGLMRGYDPVATVQDGRGPVEIWRRR